MHTLVAADRHPLTLAGLATLCRGDSQGFEWCGSAHSWAALLHLVAAQSRPPDVAVVEPAMARLEDLVAGLRHLDGFGVRAVILTADIRPVPLRVAVDAGACGIALKADPPSAILSTIRAAAVGTFSTSSDLATSMVLDARRAPRLAPREIEVLRLMAAGVPRKVIGHRMSPPVALTTVVTYLNRICDKYRDLGRPVYCPADAVRAATEDGYLPTWATPPSETPACAS